MRFRILGIWLAALMGALALYTPFVNAPYFSDDLLFYFTPPAQHWYLYFGKAAVVFHAYRPLEAIVLSTIQSHLRFDTWPIHVIALAAHAGLCCVIWLAAIRLRFKPSEAFVASALMLVSQVAEPALLGNDTLSQVVSAFLGASSMWLLSKPLVEGKAGSSLSTARLAASIGCYLASLFFKETALGFLLVAGLLTCFIALRETTWGRRLLSLARLLLPYGLATGLYLLARIHAGGPVSSSGDYRLNVGMNGLRNLGLFLFASLNPFSTVTTAVSAELRDEDTLLIVIGTVSFLAIVILTGVLTSSRKILSLILLACAAGALFPAFLLQHISELYLYNAFPFLALLFAGAFGSLWRRGKAVRVVVVICLGVMFCGQVIAVRQKSSLMYKNGQTAAGMRATLSPYIEKLPPHSTVLLVRNNPPAPRYSVFLLNGLDVLEYGAPKLGPMYGRPDVDVRIVNGSDIPFIRADDHILILALQGGVLRPFQTPIAAALR